VGFGVGVAVELLEGANVVELLADVVVGTSVLLLVGV
jgi:hypothetical protein